MPGKLMVVGTPIGNLGDLSPRAQQTLAECDFIAAEDTRVTLRLLNHFGIKKPMISYFEHNKLERGEIICSRIEAGETCALVTDAGMPAISDPESCRSRSVPPGDRGGGGARPERGDHGAGGFRAAYRPFYV